MFRRKAVSLLAALGVLLGGLVAANAPASAAGPAITVMQPPTPSKRDRVLHNKVRVPKHTPPTSGGVSTLLGTPYWYAGARMDTTSVTPPITNVYANLGGSVSGPYLDTAHDSHTLVEHAVRRVFNSNAGLIEAGMTVDPTVYGDSQRRLFVYYWDENGVGQGYNNNFTLWTGRTYSPGDVITATKSIGWHYDSGNWWLALGGTWVGYFSTSLWPNVTFDHVGEFLGFGEVAQGGSISRTYSCSDMGTGQDSSSSSSLLYSSVTMNGTGTGVSMSALSASGSNFTTNMLSARSYRLGGPGTNSTGGSPGNVGSC